MATSANNTCIRCGKPGTSRCSRCRKVNYCGSACQVAHWKSGHKGECAVLSSTAAEFIEPSPSPTAASEGKKALTSSDGAAARAPEVPVDQRLFPSKRIQQMMSFEGDEHWRIGGGLVNMGNTCFVSAVLQCLTYTRPLTTLLLHTDHAKSCTLSNPPPEKKPQFCVWCAMEKHVRSTYDYEWFAPRDFLLNIRKIGEFEFLHQEDAHEFNISLLGKMQHSVLANVDKKVDFATEETSFVYQMFGGRMQSQIKCLSCSHVSTRWESFLDLNLELSAGNSIEEALQSFTAVEALGEDIGWKCERCQKPVAAQKQLTIYDSPNILTIHLKRFDFMRGGVKLNKSVVFREELDLRRAVSKSKQNDLCEYSLYGVVVHYGPTMYSGHYVAFVKIADQWYLFDDKKVVPVAAAVVLKQPAYMLYYRKQYADTSSSADQKKKLAMRSRKGLRESDEVREVEISDKSVASSQSTPPYRVYAVEQQSAGDSYVNDLVVRVELPSVSNIASSVLTADGEGTLTLDSENEAYLRLRLPPLSLDRLTASFYSTDRLLLVTAPMLLDDLGKSSSVSSATRIPIRVVEGKCTMQFDANNELDIAHEPRPGAPQPSPIPKAAAGKKAVSEAERLNVEQTTYASLYREIGSGPVSHPAVAGKPAAAPAAAKIGRNDPCPCGTGKKYKQCHGKNA